MKKNYLFIIALAAILTVVGVGCYWAGSSQTPSATTAGTGQFPMPFSLGGVGVLLAVIKWFISKVVLVIATVFKLIIAFLLLMAVGMGVIYLF
ncbi:MAG: hypothetical protein RR705_02920 [Lachnospiraceae bacterium]